MIIFLTNIPETTRYDDIIRFVSPAIKGGLLHKKGEIGRVQMLIIKDMDKNTIEHHGLVTVDPDSAAKRAIEKLNRRPFLGVNTRVREYIYRSWHNDPRIQDMPPNYVLICQRKGDRRRSNLKQLIVNHNARGHFNYSFD